MFRENAQNHPKSRTPGKRLTPWTGFSVLSGNFGQKTRIPENRPSERPQDARNGLRMSFGHPGPYGPQKARKRLLRRFVLFATANCRFRTSFWNEPGLIGTARQNSGSNPDPLDLVEGNTLVAPVLELRRLGVCMPGQVLRHLDPSLRVFKICRDARCPKRVIADLGRDPCGLRPSPEHFTGAVPVEPALG